VRESYSIRRNSWQAPKPRPMKNNFLGELRSKRPHPISAFLISTFQSEGWDFIVIPHSAHLTLPSHKSNILPPSQALERPLQSATRGGVGASHEQLTAG